MQHMRDGQPKAAKDYLIFPLDVADEQSAYDWIDRLGDKVGLFKVGLELFIQVGPRIVRHIKATTQAGVFLDLKLHDIPATVKRAMSRIADLGVTFATVHCGESVRMLQAAVDGSQQQVGILGVTVLTSIGSEDLKQSGLQPDLAANIKQLVLKRARLAKQAGCVGVICSGLEAADIKAALGNDFLTVTPGIRPAWNLSQDDQKRIVTPEMAIRDGADDLVIGRPIRDAAFPEEVVRQIIRNIEKVLAAA